MCVKTSLSGTQTLQCAGFLGQQSVQLPPRVRVLSPALRGDRRHLTDIHFKTGAYGGNVCEDETVMRCLLTSCLSMHPETLGSIKCLRVESCPLPPRGSVEESISSH